MWYMGLGFYNIPNDFQQTEFPLSIPVDDAVKAQWDSRGEEILCWNGSQLVPYVPEPPQPEPVPYVESIFMRQCRLILLRNGMLDAVNSAVTQLGPEAEIEWEYSSEVRRDNPLVSKITSQMGMSERQMDELFYAASLL